MTGDEYPPPGRTCGAHEACALLAGAIMGVFVLVALVLAAIILALLA